MRFKSAVIAAFAVMASTGVSAEPLVVNLDRAQILRLEKDAANVIIGNPAYFDVTLEEPNVLVLFGKMVGETNMIILDDNDREILSVPVVVMPDRNDRVTVYTAVRGGTGALHTSYACSGRCAPVAGGDAGVAPAAPPPPPPSEPAQ